MIQFRPPQASLGQKSKNDSGHPPRIPQFALGSGGEEGQLSSISVELRSWLARISRENCLDAISDSIVVELEYVEDPPRWAELESLVDGSAGASPSQAPARFSVDPPVSAGREAVGNSLGCSQSQSSKEDRISLT